MDERRDVPGQRNWQSVRTVLEGLILAGILACVGALWGLRESIGKQSESIIKLQTQIEVMQRDGAALTNQLAVIPAISRQVDRIQLQVEGHERRVSDLEQLRRVR